MQNIRREDLLKKPGISESLDWAEALLQLNRNVLNEETVEKYVRELSLFSELEADEFKKLAQSDDLERSAVPG